MRTSSWRTRVSAVVVALGLSVAGASTAHAGGGDDGGPLRDRLKVACARIPNIQHRMEVAITHLTAGADVKGSIAWVESKIAAAEANNRPRVAEDLRNRLVIMQDRLTLIQDRQARLTSLAQRCSELGAPA